MGTRAHDKVNMKAASRGSRARGNSIPPGPLRQGARRSPHEEAFRSLIRIGGLIKRLAEPRMARFGITPSQWGILRSLWRLEQAGESGPRMGELGEILLVRPPSLSATLDRMERGGLIVRKDDSSDQRSRRVHLTEAGRRLLERVLADHSTWIAGLMSGLSRSEQSDLRTLVSRLGDHLEVLLNTDGGPAIAREPAGGESRAQRLRRSA